MFVSAGIRTSIFVPALAAACAAGCSFHPSIPQPAAHVAEAMRNIHAATVGSLYVAASGSNVYAFAPGTTTPKLTITAGISNPTSLLFDSSNNLYVANLGPGATGSVTEYANGQGSPVRTITAGVNAPLFGSLAAAPDGTLIVASQAGISEYHPGATKPFFNKPKPASDVVAASPSTIDATMPFNLVSNFTFGNRFPNFVISNAMAPGSLAIDTSGTLYVANSCGPGCIVGVYDRNGKFVRNLNADGPVQVLVDPSQNVWIYNFGEFNEFVIAYHQGGTVPFITIFKGLNFVQAIAVDSAQTLYAANRHGRKLILEYAGGSKSPTLSFTLPNNQGATALTIAPPGL